MPFRIELHDGAVDVLCLSEAEVGTTATLGHPQGPSQVQVVVVNQLQTETSLRKTPDKVK